MSVELQVWVVPKQRGFRPSLEQVAALANSLQQQKWVPSADAPGQRQRVLELLPGEEGPISKKPMREHVRGDKPFTAAWLECLSEHEVLLEWNVDDSAEAGAQYPFTFDPYPDEGPPYFSTRLLWSHDYVYQTNECVTPFEEKDTKCSCGEQLAYNTGWSPMSGSGRIHRTCINCGRDFDISDSACELMDAWTGEPSTLRGGLTFRFAFQIDCGKHFPREEADARRFTLRPELLALWTTHIGVPFEQVMSAE